MALVRRCHTTASSRRGGDRRLEISQAKGEAAANDLRRDRVPALAHTNGHPRDRFFGAGEPQEQQLDLVTGRPPRGKWRVGQPGQCRIEGETPPRRDEGGDFRQHQEGGAKGGGVRLKRGEPGGDQVGIRRSAARFERQKLAGENGLSGTVRTGDMRFSAAGSYGDLAVHQAREEEISGFTQSGYGLSKDRNLLIHWDGELLKRSRRTVADHNLQLMKDIAIEPWNRTSITLNVQQSVLKHVI